MFKRGDIVFVAKKAVGGENGWTNSWVSEMDSGVGNWSTVIEDSGSMGVALYPFGRCFPAHILISLEQFRANLKKGMEVVILGKPHANETRIFNFNKAMEASVGKTGKVVDLFFRQTGESPIGFKVAIAGESFWYQATSLSVPDGFKVRAHKYPVGSYVLVNKEGHSLHRKFAEITEIRPDFNYLVKRGMEKHVIYEDELTITNNPESIAKVVADNSRVYTFKERLNAESRMRTDTRGTVDYGVVLKGNHEEMNLNDSCYFRMSTYKGAQEIVVNLARVEKRFITHKVKLEDYKKYLNFLLFQSPWSYVYKDVTTVDDALENGISIRTDVTVNEAMVAMMSIREGYDIGRKLPAFSLMIDNGINPNVAYLVANMIFGNDSGEFYPTHMSSPHGVMDYCMSLDAVIKFMKNPFEHDTQKGQLLKDGHASYRIFDTVDPDREEHDDDVLTVGRYVTNHVTPKCQKTGSGFGARQTLSPETVIAVAKDVEEMYGKA